MRVFADCGSGFLRQKSSQLRASKLVQPRCMPRHISLQDAAAARPFSYLAAGATSISHTKLHTESCTENACSQQRLLAHRFAPAPTIHISHLIHICTHCAVPCSCMGIHPRRRLWRHGRRQSLGRPWLWGGLCRARHEICDATILLHRMHSNNIFCCSASWPVSCRERAMVMFLEFPPER